MINPPYHDEAQHDASPDDSKRTANTAKTGDLVVWIASAARALKPTGTLTLIHRSDCLDAVLAGLNGSFGDTQILPILPLTDALPKRIILRAYKGKNGPPRKCRALILHKPEGGYTDEAETILRHAKALGFALV